MPAKPVNRKSASRQTTPQSVEPSASTRSPRQSQRRHTREKKDVSTSSPAQQKRVKRVLPIVDEENEQVEKEAQHHDLNSSDGVAPEAAHDASAISNDLTLLEALDKDLIIDNLQSLYQDSINILTLFRPNSFPTTVKDLNSPLSATAKRFKNFSTRFQASLEPYNTNNRYISTSLIARKLTDSTEHTEGPWRPDPVLQLANLSQLISRLSQTDKEVNFELLGSTYEDFPRPFVGSSIKHIDDFVGTILLEPTIDFAISLHTQAFIWTLPGVMRKDSFDPDGLLSQFFFGCWESERTGDIDGVSDGLPDNVIGAATKRMDQIRKTFSKDSRRPVDYRRLRLEFPWSDFLQEAATWVNMRREELENEVRKTGIEKIVERLTAEDFSAWSAQGSSVADEEVRTSGKEPSVLDRNTEPQTLGTPVAHGRRSSSMSKSAMARKLQRLKEHKMMREDGEEADDDDGEEEEDSEEVRKDADGISQELDDEEEDEVLEVDETPRHVTNEVATHLVEDDDPPVLLNNDDDEEDDNRRNESPPTVPSNLQSTQQRKAPHPQVQTVMDTLKRHAMQGNKENINSVRPRSYLDRRPDATRVEWNESQSNPSQSHEEDIHNVGFDAEDEEGDDDFEIDSRPQKKARMSQNQAASNQPPSSTSARSRPILSRTVPPSSSQPPPSAQPQYLQAADIADSSPVDSTISSTLPVRTNIPSVDKNDNNQPISASQDYRRVNVEAKTTIRKFRAVASHGLPIQARDRAAPQIRKAYTNEEIERLMELMAIHGTSWSTILKEDQHHPDGPVLENRTQVQLKDKARNMKMDYLMNCRKLPPGFLYVTIKQADRQKLSDLGLPLIQDEE